MKKSNRHSLIIDGNYFIFRTLYILPRSKSNSLLETESDVQTFVSKLATDFSHQIKLFETIIDHVVWTVDSRSWRKDFYPESNYKGNRKSDSSINWDNFTKASNDFIDILKSNGVTISRIDGAEGDDLMYAWNSELLSKDKSSIIITGDKDIVQLVTKNNNGAYTLVFSPAHKKLYTYEGFTEWLSKTNESASDDIFAAIKKSADTTEQNKKTLSELIKKKKLSINEINPDQFKIEKVLTGDAGDNIPSVYSYRLKNRNYSISPNKANKIVEEYLKKHKNLTYRHLYNEDLIRDLANITAKVMKGNHLSVEKIIDNIRFNTNMIVLSPESIPAEILDDMLNHIESVYENSNFKLSSSLSMKSMLSGSKYETSDNSVRVSASIFKNAETTDFSFIKKTS